jgi:hypothetical protein
VAKKTIEDLEAERQALDVQIAETEKPVLEAAIAFLNSPETEAFIQAVNSHRAGISINTSGNVLGGIVNSINMARTTLSQRVSTHNMMITNAAKQ